MVQLEVRSPHQTVQKVVMRSNSKGKVHEVAWLHDWLERAIKNDMNRGRIRTGSNCDPTKYHNRIMKVH